jgi:hypothetical protein
MNLLLRLLLALLLLLAITVGLLAWALARGVTVDAVSLGGVRVERLSMHLDGKLALDVGRVIVAREATAQSSEGSNFAGTLNPVRVRELLHGIHFLASIFKHIDIQHIEAGSLDASFRYREQDAGHFNLHSPRADIELALGFEGDQLVVDVVQLAAPDLGIQGSGQLRVDPADRQLSANLQGVIADTLPVQLSVEADRRQLDFSGKGLASVASIVPIVELFKLSPKVSPWIVDYLRGARYTLRDISGTLPYRDPARILQTLRVRAHVEDVAYTFAQGLEPVLADAADVVFEQGVLHIDPHAATFYGQDGGASDVAIDFNDGRYVVMVDVRTRAQASGGVLTLLEHYGIPFPLEQVAGLTDVDLTLSIDLAPVKVSTAGRFAGVDSLIDIGGQRFAVAQFDIGLNDSAIAFNRLDVALRELFSATVSGGLDVGVGQGDLDIALEHFSWRPAASGPALQASTGSSAGGPVQLQYHFRPAGDSIEVAASSWRYGDLPIALGGFSSPFDRQTLSGSLERVAVSLVPWLRLEVSGTYGASAPFAQLDIQLLALERKRLRLMQAPAAVAVTVGRDIQIATDRSTRLSLNDMVINLAPSRARYADGVLNIDNKGLTIGPATTTGLRGQLDLARGRGQLALSALDVEGGPGGTLFSAAQRLPLELSWGDGEAQLSAPALGLAFEHDSDGSWALSCQDLSKLAVASPLLQRFNIDTGHGQVLSASGGAPYEFSGLLVYPQGLIIEGDTPVHDYHFRGRYDVGKTAVVVNDKVHIDLIDGVRISSSDVGYSLPALMQIIAGQRSDVVPGRDAVGAKVSRDGGAGRSPDAEGMRVNLLARNSFLYLGGKQRALANGLTARYAGGKASAELYYRGGKALFEYSGQGLHLVGHGFDDSFMNALIPAGTFDGGLLEFRAQGRPDDLAAVVRIEDSTIKSFKTLYNLLAFVDTVPGLLTFHLPDYDEEGLPMTEAYIGFDYNSGVIAVKTAHLDAEEMNLRGIGSIDLNAKTTDLTINFISGAHKRLEKIPLLGYVLTGGAKKPSLTLKVTGSLEDPDISNTAFKEVAVYPFAVIERTILLPVHMAKAVRGKDAPDAL